MKPPLTPQREILDRLRRIETRVTTMCIAQGIDGPRAKPVFTHGLSDNQLTPTIVVPSRHSTLAEILAAAPDHWTGPVRLIIGGETIGRLDIGDRSS